MASPSGAGPHRQLLGLLRRPACPPCARCSTGGELDYLTGDYLAELTMLILGRDRLKHPDRGYAKTFLTQLEECLGLALTAACAIVANAGGLNPAGLADAVRALAERLGVPVRVAHVEGDDLSGPRRRARAGQAADGQRLPGRLGHRRLPATRRRHRRHRPGHRRLGDRRARGRPLRLAAAPTTTALAGAVVAGHVIECGVQATGGNYSFFTEIPDLTLRRLPARRDPRRRLVGDHQAPRHRRRWSASTPSPRSCSTRSPARATPTPT